MMKSPVYVCPVPEEQQPINEYQELKESWFFNWVRLKLPNYVIKLTWVWGLSWLVSGPIAAVSFPPQKAIIKFLLCGGAGASIFLILSLLRLYLGWFYVRDRLIRETIVYEESGWYDGQTWTKTPEILARDRLIVSYELQPILRRLHWTFGFLIIVVIGGNIIWRVLSAT
ncbi:hypothetical protein BJP34_12575 [Moorena producens PAL-8-15-08-1]|uniref:DUF1230 domain-containing protein n=3 Tax=Coleofasciculaceae TaxID=1892251 RepID=A0A1D8U370_9CYAN|nr:hypothetical protein BJP34_12575 [Moorena producens PAL-8-15-08-1]NEO13677.1 CGLD27 family protein [Moorena sp. SIO3E8]NEQ03314.1 CGLD27 family protein [Moorena sp. SIO3F7]OLT63232.1 hypothetical protein BJP37_11340 [Moorena bouillonii PNG]